MKDIFQIGFIFCIGMMLIAKPPEENEVAHEEDPNITAVAAIRKEEATIIIDTVYIQSAEKTADIAPTTTNGYTLSLFSMIIMALAVFAHNRAKGTQKPPKSGYKSPYKRITRHFVAAKKYMTTDEEGREVEETMIITKDNAKSMVEGRSPILTDLDVHFVLLAFAQYNKTEVEQLPIHAIEEAKKLWAEGLGAARIVKAKIGMGRSYVVASISGFNAALKYGRGAAEAE